MSRMSEYRQALTRLDPRRWDEFLMAESRLPGPRGNLELAMAAGDLASESQAVSWLEKDQPDLGTNHPCAFLTFCALLALGKLIAEQDDRFLGILRGFASDDRWRIREGVAMALQLIGDADRRRMLRIAEEWAKGSMLEARAAVAGIAEPRLLDCPESAGDAMRILDIATTKIACAGDRKSEEYRILKQALCYCWSVACAAYPDEGKKAMERWFAHTDSGVRQVMKENLKKSRLRKKQPEWTLFWLKHIN